MPDKALSLSLAVLALLALLVGCESRVSLGNRCTSDADCSGLSCRYGRCRAQCASAADCAGDAICIGEAGRGVCTVPTLDTCASSCGDGLVCAGEICSTPCTTALDECLAGSRCEPVSGVSVCVARPSVDAGPEDAAITPDAPAERPDASGDAAIPPPTTRRGLCLGEEHACAIRAGRVYCWGTSAAGELGDGLDDATGRAAPDSCGGRACSTRPRTPVQLEEATVLPLEDVVELACGERHACARTGAGRVYCWGSASDGALGASGRAGHVAMAVTGITDAVALTGGRHHKCARVSSGYRCWGGDVWSGFFDDRLGSGTGSPAMSDVPIASPSFADLAELTAGAFYTCGIQPGGEVRCHGVDEAGVLGGEGPQRVVPEGAAIAGTRGASRLGSGVVTACALIDGAIVCWGGNAHGELGTSDDHACTGLHGRCRGSASAVVERGGRTFTSLSTGVSETICAVTGAGGVACWGRNDLGQAGDGSLSNLYEVGPDVRGAGGPLTNVVEVETGAATSCARTADERVFCWGDDSVGKRGCGAFDTEPHAAACEVLFP